MTDNGFIRYVLLFLLFAIVITYLLCNTGVISDDFDAIARVRGVNVTDLLVPRGAFYFIETPLLYYTHYIWYRFIDIDNQTILNAFKIAYIIISFYLISRFFSIYISAKDAFLISFMFIFFPSHDATTYWFMGQYLTLSIAFYLYAFYLAHRNRLFFAFLFAIAGSFISYGSPIIAVSMFLLFCLNKEFKKAFVILIPNIVYSIYYVSLSKLARLGVDKISGSLDLVSIVRQFLFQVVTFADAVLGPSMWLKVYYSFSQLTLVSLIVAAVLTAFFYLVYGKYDGRHNKRLITSLVVMMVASFLAFSLTGKYPQLAFNLGNRVTIFGSLLLAYVIVMLPASRIIRTAIFGVLIFTILGISGHWKEWNLEQLKVISNIRNNRYLADYKEGSTIYVSGHQYSKYGPLNHIEFLSEGPVSAALVKILYNKEVYFNPINKRHVYIDGKLIDRRDDLELKIDDFINVYDSEKDVLFKIKAVDINAYIATLPRNVRHWVDLINSPYLRDMGVKLMPRLKYQY